MQLTEAHGGLAPVMARLRERAGRVKTAKRRSAAEGSLEAPQRSRTIECRSDASSRARAKNHCVVVVLDRSARPLTCLAARETNRGGTCRRRLCRRMVPSVRASHRRDSGSRCSLRRSGTRSFRFSRACLLVRILSCSSGNESTISHEARRRIVRGGAFTGFAHDGRLEAM